MNSTMISDKPSDTVARQLRDEYEAQQVLFGVQPSLVQRFLEAQGRQLGDTLAQHERVSQARFTLPERIVTEAHDRPVAVPPESREQLAGGLIDRLTRGDVRSALRQRLAELEQSSPRSVAVAAGLVRYATVTHMVHNMLPAGRSVTYVPVEGEEIPSIPVGDVLEPASAITATTDAIAEESDESVDPEGERNGEGRGELQVPYAPSARKFFLPRWVAFDEETRLLVNSVSEAEAHIASMQRFLHILHLSVGLASYMVADQDYQIKRYGMLGQLVNQGRALARYQTSEIIATIKQRAAAHDLNRGLSLSLPYFDDQVLQIKLYDFEVIPAGRIMFVPAFVVRASREEQGKVAQDTRLDHSTRIHLLAGLGALEQAFAPQLHP
jgi:hypothetical protein